MTAFVLPRIVMTAIDAAMRLKAGTLVPWQCEPAFWDETRIPKKLILGDIERDKQWDTNELRSFCRSVQVWGVVNREEKCLARFGMSVSVKRGEEDPDDDAPWHITSVNYLGLEHNPDGTWSEKEQVAGIGAAIL